MLLPATFTVTHRNVWPLKFSSNNCAYHRAKNVQFYLHCTWECAEELLVLTLQKEVLEKNVWILE